MGEWTEVAIAEAPLEIIDGDRGTNYPKQDDFASVGHCLFLNAGNVTNAGFSFSDCSFISEDKDAALRKGKAKRDDIVLTTRGTVGNVALYDVSVPYEHVRINSGMVLLRPDTSKLSPRFLYQFVRSDVFRERVAALTTGSAQPQLPICDIKRIEFPLPPLPEQRAIAHILGALDDKIECNRRRNQTLEAMARALFQDWFVDFGPVRARMESQEPYLPADLWQLFPDRLDAEGKPEGWRQDSLSSFTNLKNGYAFKSQDWRDRGVPVVKIGSVKPSFVDLSQVSFIDEDLAQQRELFRLKVGDMLVGLTGYVGKTGRIPPTVVCPMLNQRVGKFEPKKGLESFVFANVRMPEFKVFAESKSHGSAQANVSASDLLMYPVINPGRQIVEAFCGISDSVFAKQSTNEGETAILAQLRDTLLPKLISGELRVPDAERIVGAAV
jgi:type I restriction enzyme S subunit